MQPVTIKAAIQNVFTTKDTVDLKLSDLPEIKLPIKLTIENVEPIVANFMQKIAHIKDEIEAGTILLNELRSDRQILGELKNQLYDLEVKETQEAFDLDENTEWHEKSQFIRLFLVSQKGDELEQEQKEAALAKSIAEQFSEVITDFELIIDHYILEIGELSAPEFGLMVEEWRGIGNLKDSLLSIQRNIRVGEGMLESSVSCWSCYSSNSVDNSSGTKYFVQADKQLEQQINILSPVYENLTEKLESKIAEIREKLFL